MRLTALKVKTLNSPGRYPDGHGLYLQVRSPGCRSWLFRFQKDGRGHWMGLGSAEIVSLHQAREKAIEMRQSLAAGKNPIIDRKLLTTRLKSAVNMSFDACALAYIESHKPSWRNPKHYQQWGNTLRTYAFPVLGSLPVSEIELLHVEAVLRPIWDRIPETASRVRSRIECVLAWATVRGYRKGANPAIWRHNLDKLFPKRSSVRSVKHHSALSIGETQSLIKTLDHLPGVTPLALQFIILTAARTSEALRATWAEFDLERGIWSIPGERMKSKRPHRVPLSPKALQLLRKLHSMNQSEWVFPGWTKNKHLSNTAVLVLLRKQKITATVHGFRSTFRDWAAEETNFPNEVSEMALAHTIKDKAEAAYRRGDLLEKRRGLLLEWERRLYE